MINGLYAVEFTGFGPGSGGRVYLQDGKIDGSDAGFKWDGVYVLSGTTLSASVRAIPTADVINVFGDSHQLELEISGVVNSESIEVEGYRANLSGQRLTAVLRKIEL